VFKLVLPAGTVSTFVEDGLLTPGSHGFPPFGANGLAFNKAGTQLFIANTADDRILRYDLALGTVSIFAESINGADGIAFDRHGRLWVCANQGDELVALNALGRVVERRGSFRGGATIYVTNLALPLTEAEGDEPEEDVTTYTVSRIAHD
jgi:sugar lactone lactonase YvrE